MSTLDNLTAKIIKDSHEKGSAIIKNAEQEAAKLIETKVSEANKIKDSILAEGNRDAEMQKSLIVSAKQIEVRDAMLKAKHELIAKTFDLALEKLNQLPLNEYTAFLEKYLLQMDIDGDEEILVPEKYNDINLADINKSMTAKGKKGLLKLGSRPVSGGFVVLKNDVENNNTFEALLDYYRDDLESLVAENLF